MHIREEHVRQALDAAADGPVPEGCVGAGTGMTCFDFKGGIGTSSRVVSVYDRTCTVGVLAMTNFGVRHRLVIDGVPVGREITDLMPIEPPREGSCIVVLATDAPMTARQCERMAKRCSLGLAVTGSYAGDSSGEFMLAFTTAHRIPRVTTTTLDLATVGNDALSCLFEAAVDATTEAVINSLCMAETTEGRAGSKTYALPLDRVVEVMGRFGRDIGPPAGV